MQNGRFYSEVCTIEKHRHHVVIKNPTPRITQAIYQLSRDYTEFGQIFDPVTKKRRWAPVKTYGLYINKGQEFRFHINQCNQLLDYIRRAMVNESDYKVVDIQSTWEPDIEHYVVDPKFVLYDYQEEGVEYVVDPAPNNIAPLVMVPTGGGKTVMACSAAAVLGKRLAIGVLAQYIDKWVKDVKDILGIEKKEICVIQGSDILERATLYPGSGYQMPKIFIYSINTMNKWFDIYAESPSDPRLEAYGCMPYEFFEHLKIGTLILDEVHQHPYAIFRQYCYADVPKVINLSATMLTKQYVLKTVQGMMFPKTKRFDKIKMKKYINYFACQYQITDFHRGYIQTTEWMQNTYSHSAFEKSIMSSRNKVVKERYFKLILDLFEQTHMKRRIPGDKALIFFFSKAMAMEMAERIKARWPSLKTDWYLAGSNYGTIFEMDVICSTVLKSGTALDIPNLRDVYQTISLDSPNANVQALGRLRELKRPNDNDVNYYQIYSSSIPKHLDYHESRMPFMEERSATVGKLFLGTIEPPPQKLK